MARAAIAAHCKGCGRAVTCLSTDVLDDQGNPQQDDFGETAQSATLYGRCDGCGLPAEVVPYTPVPFSGQPIDPSKPRMAAHVGPFGPVPTADALRPQVPTGLTRAGSALSTSTGVGTPAPAVVSERIAGPVEGIAPPNTQPMNLTNTHDARAQYEGDAYAPVQEQAVSDESISEDDGA